MAMKLRVLRDMTIAFGASVALVLLIGPSPVHSKDEGESAGSETCYFAGGEYEPNQKVCIDGYEHRCNGHTGVLVRGSKQC